MAFAKIYDTEFGQILITNDTRENQDGDDVASINAFFKVNENFGICEISLKFAEGDEQECDKFFDDMNKDTATKMVRETINSLRSSI